jgi:preprotein translocase subunit SecE
MDNRKTIIASYVIGSMALWFLTRQGLQALFVGFYQVRKMPNFALIRELVPVVAGSVLFVALLWNSKVNTFLDEVVSELRKVTWPTREDVVKSTIVVLGCVLFASGVIAIFDVAFGKMISYLLHS